ncbi:cutinase family protein [Candidatus Saccharibacteria bacterium]|nr:cutinase family protein [Candidatus Saccharibacteria bacterium]
MRGKNLILTLIILAGMVPNIVFSRDAGAEKCPDLRVVFARGSGSSMDDDENYNEFRLSIEEKLVGTNIDYEFINLDYPAVGINNLGVLLGAYFGAGEAYEFGDSVKSGVKKLDNLVNGSCANTKYVLGGYSQGAMVVSRALGSLSADRIIYAATFGDPKLYLPEGAGIIPAACKNENLSDYRMYVPDCRAYKGMLGSYQPYQPEAYIGKLGTWCNKGDIMCSSHLNISDHLAYVADGLYEDASRVIFDKIAKAFGIENNYSSPHDTAILIDTTGSMETLIDKYRAEALRLTQETLGKGGRVALFEYRDIEDMPLPLEHCNFKTCTLEKFESELESLQTEDGGDTPESMLSASLNVMRTLEWKQGATKTLIVLTDSGYHSPDRDGTTVLDVINASRSIDPVYIYVVGDPVSEESYREITEATGGRFLSINGDLAGLTNEVLERYESLPRVETTSESSEKPILHIVSAEKISENEIKIKIETNGVRVLVVINDAVVGETTEKEFVVSGLKGDVNEILLVPLGEDVRGDGVKINVAGAGYGSNGGSNAGGDAGDMLVPLAPNTGMKKAQQISC